MLTVSRPGVAIDEITEFNKDERFIKIPIEKYLRLEDVTPIAPQYALINAINDPRFRFVVACLSRRTGKTYMANVIAHLVTLVPMSNILIMSPNYSLSEISFSLQKNMLKKHKVELLRANHKDKILEIGNGSTIRMAAVAQADSAVGRSYDLIIFDECALEDKGDSAFNVQLRPTLDKINSKAIFISTPRGRNWFYNYFKRGFDPSLPEWITIHSDWTENPRAKEADIEEARKTCSYEEFRQEYHADFTVKQGLVYGFKKESNLLAEGLDLRYDECIAGADFGYKDATALVVIKVIENEFHVIDEYVNSEVTTDKHAAAMLDLEAKHEIDFIYADSASAQTRADLSYIYGLATYNAKKSMLEGIGFVQSLINTGRLKVAANCTHTISMLENYQWDARSLVREKPKHDEHSHIADALRYACYSHSGHIDGF